MTARNYASTQRLDKLAARKRKLEAQYAQEKAKLRERSRKARTHKLVKLGALFELVNLVDVDPAVLLGIMDQSHEYLHDAVTYQCLKDRGHAVMDERNALKRKRKNGSD